VVIIVAKLYGNKPRRIIWDFLNHISSK